MSRSAALDRGARRTLLIVDDDLLFRRAIRDDLADSGLELVEAGSLAEARKVLDGRRVDLVLLDQQLPDGLGADLCPTVLQADARTKIVFVTAFPAFDNALAAVRAGAFDYLSKPVEPEALRLAIRRSLTTLDLERSDSLLKRTHRQEAASAARVAEVFPDIRDLVEVAAASDAPVLLTGETGTGKSRLARAIHYASTRRAGELVALNCAAIPEALIESELFGHEKGSYTGATDAREGMIELADGGTLFLDEIGDMPWALQSRLLQVLEDRQVRRVGGRTSRSVDFRIVAATNVDLDRALEERRLRRDLYYRLDVLRIRVPPLRERRDDLPELVRSLLDELPGRNVELAPGELERLAAHDWPGNVRELRNVLERAILVSKGERIHPSAFLAAIAEPTPAAAPTTIETLAEVERRHVDAALRSSGGNLARTSRALGISVSTLKRKLRGRRVDGTSRTAPPSDSSVGAPRD